MATTLCELAAKASASAPEPNDERALHLSDVSMHRKLRTPQVWSVYCAVVSAEPTSPLLDAFGTHTLDQLLAAFTSVDQLSPPVADVKVVFLRAAKALHRDTELDADELTRQFYEELSGARAARFVPEAGSRLGRPEDRSSMAQMSAGELEYMEEHMHQVSDEVAGYVFVLDGAGGGGIRAK